MPVLSRPSRDLTSLLRASADAPAGRVSEMARSLIGSEILKIAAEIRGLVASGRTVCNLTVGDFSPKQFPIPSKLKGGVLAALERGETNYPPSDGVLDLRHAVRRFYERELGLVVPVESILVTGGARPAIYGTYRTLCEPGDRVVYPTPSWNNNHYVHMVGARGVTVPCGAETRFMPTREALVRELPGARLLCLNTPLNPAGTAIASDELAGTCEAIVEENRAREKRGERPVYLMYDHVYWMLCIGDTRHVTPPELVPEVARWTIFVDGISKAFAATGLRVGWAVGPVDVIERMSAVLGHVGAWAPRAEQVATTTLLDDPDALKRYRDEFLTGISARLTRLHAGLQSMKADGLPVDSIEPMGAIYLAARLHPFGKKTPDGRVLKTNEDVRRYVLDAAGMGVVPFQAFGVPEDEGWFRMSVGAVSEAEIAEALPRLATALHGLS